MTARPPINVAGTQAAADAIRQIGKALVPPPPGPRPRRAAEPAQAPPQPPLSASERMRAREAARLGLKPLEALELMARGLTRLGLSTGPELTAELGNRTTGNRTTGTVTIHHVTARRLAVAGYVTLRHDVNLIRITPTGRQIIAARRGRLWPVARWSARIVDLDGDLDRWALATARALLADEPIPAWPGRWRATGATRVATIRQLLGLTDPTLPLEEQTRRPPP